MLNISMPYTKKLVGTVKEKLGREKRGEIRRFLKKQGFYVSFLAYFLRIGFTTRQHRQILGADLGKCLHLSDHQIP